MADIYTSRADEDTIEQVLKKGLEAKALPKWTVLRLALAQSLRLDSPPDAGFDKTEDRGSQYHLEQVTGRGQVSKEERATIDFDDPICALLSVYHDKNLFTDFADYRKLLQRHIRRGLREIQTGWRESHDFHQYLYQELFAGPDGIAETRLSHEGIVHEQDRLINALREIDIQAEIRESRDGPRLTRIFLYLPDVHDLDRLRRGLDKIAFSMGLGEQRIFATRTSGEFKVLALDIPRARESWRTIQGAELHDWTMQGQDTGEMALPVWPGVDVLGKSFPFDLAQAPHLLVAGTTGSGKSVCLHALILSLLWHQRPADLQLCLIDPKRVEFESYRRLPNLIGSRVCNDAEDSLSVLDDLVKEMERRTDALTRTGVQNLLEGRASGRLKLPFIVVFIEELADLFDQNPAAEDPLIRLVQKARATGIHLVLSTQRPDAVTFSGRLRSNIPWRIALTVQKSSESKIILDEIGAEGLTGAGDMLVRTMEGPSTRIHGVKVGPDDITAAINAFMEDKT
uniref:DNA segregation ATPase FtsK/SpoIIIE, S-DNA-T family n=1 Tax=Candidatus Kentrum sp. LFY TaxID=2126342 RepID=A0A450U997_9GAMM|nr:MAG: DNA segregation ATPase FtsK/SpoIIIE, S-DNA-T family [Candidatus Kentron sp. LFY]